VPLNIHTDPSKRGVYYSLNPGKYDHEAIKYGYMHVEGEVTGEQHESLREHAASLPAGESGTMPPLRLHLERRGCAFERWLYK